jgi:hypothetical protein
VSPDRMCTLGDMREAQPGLEVSSAPDSSGSTASSFACVLRSTRFANLAPETGTCSALPRQHFHAGADSLELNAHDGVTDCVMCPSCDCGGPYRAPALRGRHHVLTLSIELLQCCGCCSQQRHYAGSMHLPRSAAAIEPNGGVNPESTQCSLTNWRTRWPPTSNCRRRTLPDHQSPQRSAEANLPTALCDLSQMHEPVQADQM